MEYFVLRVEPYRWISIRDIWSGILTHAQENLKPFWYESGFLQLYW